MNKKILSIAAAVFISIATQAQITQRVCGTLQHHEYLKETRKNYEADRIQYEANIQKYLEDKANNRIAAMPTVTIPVVVHVVYANATESITPTQAASQVQVLNDDFAKLNSDANLVTQPTFSTVAAGANIRFCLAQRDPNGNPTTGIVYKSTTVGTFNTDDKVKSSATGGSDAWDVTKYVNIWVCDLGSMLLGYGEFPTTSISNTWGLVLNYRYTGKGGSAQSPFNLGRTGTHEFGHCFNLYHIWGDDNGACSGSDQCADTPNQADASSGPFAAGSIQTDACATSSPGFMWMNYMDYTDDGSMYMFTAGQVARMEAVVNTAPWNVLQSSNGCLPVNLAALDASMLNVISPANASSSCNNTTSTSVVLKNMGQTTLTSAVINYQMDAGTVQTFTWTGSLASLATTTVSLNPFAGLSAAAHTFSVWVTNPNNGADANSSNDAVTSTFTVSSAPTPIALPLSEGFESTTFPPTGWLLQKSNTIDANYTWTRVLNTTGLVAGSTAVARMDNYDAPVDITGQKDALRTPSLDFSAANSTLKLKFDRAHQRYSTTYIDSLNIYVSLDCGGSWSRIYTKGGAQLATITAANTSSFVPSNNNQWKSDSVSLAPYAGQGNVYVKFESRSGYGNNLYLDNINISYVANTVTGLETLEAELPVIQLYPNPNKGLFTINIYNVSKPETMEVKIINAIGQEVAKVDINKMNGEQQVDLSNLSNGVYHMVLKTASAKPVVKKIIIAK